MPGRAKAAGIRGMRGGQAALYLVVVLVALAVLAFMNANVFLSVRAKNRAMNAGDAAALAVARWQGELLNRIGADNVEHLKAALAGDAAACEEIMARQLRTCFLEPLRGISKGNEAAAANGVEEEPKGEMRRILAEHVGDILQSYVGAPELYPEPWEGAWREYASMLLVEVSNPLLAGPDTVEFADARNYFPLADKAFYNAIAGRMWCWFKFNGLWMLERDTASMPQPDFSTPGERFNSEIYPLHLTFETLADKLGSTALAEDGETTVGAAWTNIVMQLTDCTEEDIRAAPLLADPAQRWALFDARWAAWSTYGGIRFNAEEFPIVGDVKPEYDVLGASATCRVLVDAPDILGEDRTGDTAWRDLGDAALSGAEEGAAKEVNWTAAAKPFGTVEGEDGEAARATALERLVTPCFTDVRLVPVDSVAAGFDTSTADYAWVVHVRRHLPSSPRYVGRRSASCAYCALLDLWDRESFRREGQLWLKYHGDECVRPAGGGCGTGGTAHAH